MIGVYAWVPFHALEYFIMITKQRDNKENETKKTSEFPNIAKPQWWDSAFSKHWLTTPRPLSPTLGTLPRMMVGSRASWRTVGRDSSLEPSCSCVRFLHLAFLLLLFSASLFFSLPLLCTLTSLTSSFLLLPLWGDFTIVRLSRSCYI